MNYYIEATADETLPASEEDACELEKLLCMPEDWEDDPDYEYHGMVVEYGGGEIHMFDDCGESALGALPPAALEFIGKLIEKAGKPYWGFGIAYTAGRRVPGSRGGCQARIYPDGSLEFAYPTWSDPTT